MASSRLIAAGENYTPDDINNLRADVLDPTGGHKHNGVDGARLPFANLDVTGAAGSTAPPGGSKSYNDIATHVASSQGQHGLNASAYVLGANVGGMIVQGGFSSGGGSRTIYFPMAFTQGNEPANPISIVVTPKTSSPDPFSNNIGVTVVGFGSTAFSVDVDGDNVAGLFWMAMGPKT
jgi:hypothetical protein